MLKIICLFHTTTSIIMTAGLYNAALYKPAVQISDWSPYYAYLGVDGNNDDEMYNGHCYHTGLSATPWWMVDLRGQFVVEKIRFTNRGDRGSDLNNPNPLRLRNFQFDIFTHDPRNLANFPNISGDVCYNQTAPLDNGTYTFTCQTPIVGRFVRVMARLDPAYYFFACEVEVLVSSSNFDENYFLPMFDTKFVGPTLVNLTNLNSVGCLQECQVQRATNQCTAVNWVKATRTCELISVNPFIDVTSNLVSTPGTRFYIQKNNIL